MFGADGAPALTYTFFADSLGDLDNYGSTHPAVEVHADLGRLMFDTIATTTNPLSRSHHVIPQFVPVNGG
jgi:beta-lactamase class A